MTMAAIGCAVANCERRPIARELCNLHYQRWHRHGDPLIVKMAYTSRGEQPCVLDGCGDRRANRGLCAKHWQRLAKTGTTARRTESCVVCGGWMPESKPSPSTTCSEKCHRSSERQRANNLMKNYGLTEGDYDAMLASQNGQCAICDTTEPGGRGKTRFFIDHDHKTGAVRGLLCANCNAGIGQLGDDIQRVERALEYLRACAPLNTGGA